MAFRSEEEKTADILMYEKKAKASEICERYKKTKKWADLSAVIALIAFSAIAFPLFYSAYDTESIIGMILIVAGVVLLTVAARLTVGAILSRSLSTFVRWGALSEKWTVARKNMHDLEAKFADQTVFEDDIKKAEKRLMDASDALIAFADKKGINIDD